MRKKNYFMRIDIYATVIKILQNWEKEFRLVKFYTDYQTIDGIELTL